VRAPRPVNPLRALFTVDEDRVRPRRGVIVLAAVALVVLGGFAWLRESSLVEVREVEVTGLSARDAPRIRAALEAAAGEMTTLHVREGRLRDAVADHPAVRDLEADADFPHTLRIRVLEHDPVGALSSREGKVPVAADGTLLRALPGDGLASIPVDRLPHGERVTAGRGWRGVVLLARAPQPIRKRIERVTWGPRGVAAHLRDGPAVLFGTLGELEVKWAVAARVMADHAAAGATAIDVRMPSRPAVAGLPPLPGDD
jgi:cell division protein FtsQ